MVTEAEKNNCSLFRHRWCLLLSLTFLLFLGSYSPSAEAGGVFFNPSPGIFCPPLVGAPEGPPSLFGLVFPPYFGGEVSFRPVYLTMSQGSISNANPNINLTYPLVAGDLVRDFNMNPSISVVETMLRVQISRLSFRMIFGLKFSDFNGTLVVPGPNYVLSEFEYFKYRVGLDFDVLCWGRSRAGVNIDLFPDEPVFTVTDSRVRPSDSTAPYRVAGGNAFTVGVHAVYNPPLFVWDWSWIFEARMSWPARKDIHLTEYDFAAGLKSPETNRGSAAFRGGYKRILLDFTSGLASFNGAWDGWYGEFVYYY